MKYLLDGDNVLGTWPERSRSTVEKRRLASEVRAFSRRAGPRVVIVFDGDLPAADRGGSEVLVAGPGRSADERILEFLNDLTDTAGWTIVTSDRSLADRCRHLGAAVERSDRFRPRLRGA